MRFTVGRSTPVGVILWEGDRGRGADPSVPWRGRGLAFGRKGEKME